MPQGQQYAEQLGELRRQIAEPIRGIILLEFATLPQLESIVASLRAVDLTRACIEVPYDPPRENAVIYLERVRQEVSDGPSDPLPLLILRPLQLPDASNDHPIVVEFWRALNFRRESLGALPAQILLCVDPWNHERLVDYAGDLRSWTAPKFHLLPADTEGIEPSKGLAALSSFAEFSISPEAAQRRWETFWPELERARAEHRLEPSHFRQYILPLFEAALAQGNLVRARLVRDAAHGLSHPEEDMIQWHRLNTMLACAAQDFLSAEDHIRKLLEIANRNPDQYIRRKAFDALSGGTKLLRNFGQFALAEELLRNQCLLADQLFGSGHHNTLASRNNLANALKAQGKHAEAELEHRTVLAICERVFGTTHSNTLICRNNLAIALQAQGKYTEAAHEQRAALSILNQVYGPEHLETLATRNNLAIVLQIQGKQAEAELEHRSVLAIRERILGSEHPDTLATRNNLAIALGSQGKHAEAEREHRALLAIRERSLGQEHPETLTSRGNLAIELQRQSKHKEAEYENRAVAALRERLLGSAHPDTLTSRGNLASVLQSQGKQAEADQENRAVLAIRERVLGVEHPDTLVSRNNVANALEGQSRLSEAEREHRAVIAIRERVLGLQNPEVFRSYFNLARCLAKQKKNSEAIILARRACEGSKMVLGEHHPDTKEAEALVQHLEKEQKI